MSQGHEVDPSSANEICCPGRIVQTGSGDVPAGLGWITTSAPHPYPMPQDNWPLAVTVSPASSGRVGSGWLDRLDVDAGPVGAGAQPATRTRTAATKSLITALTLPPIVWFQSR